MKNEIIWSVVDLKEVINYFVKGYKIKGKKIFAHEVFFDSNKNKFILKLFIENGN